MRAIASAVALVVLALVACTEQEPPPQPAQMPHCFGGPMVFFDSGSVALSDQGRRSLRSAFTDRGFCSFGWIDEARSSVCVHVAGHTDQSGDEAANWQLSRRRAEVVAEYLIELGLPRERIVVQAKGSSAPLVIQPGPNGREPQNRRVTILVERLKDPSAPCQ